jgi:hypothetical protein
VAAPSATRANEQRNAQAGLIVMLLRDLVKVWQLLRPDSLHRSMPAWVAAVHAVTSRYAPMAATLAADYYEAERAAANAAGRFTVPFADAPTEGHVDAVMRWATKDLWSRNPDTLTERVHAAKSNAESAAAKLVEDVGRLTITYAVQKDPAAVGWARTASPGACAFCRMLAQRGPVYGADTVGFRAHNDCHCMAMPLFKGQKWAPTAMVREWQKQYEQAAKAPGDPLKNLRRIVGR